MRRQKINAKWEADLNKRISDNRKIVIHERLVGALRNTCSVIEGVMDALPNLPTAKLRLSEARALLAELDVKP